MVPVSAMVQVSERVGSIMKGSIKAVSGSGMASMSEASMLFQPRMLEPSKPRPSLKEASSISLIGRLKCCQVPKVSTNLTSTILAPFFFAISNTLLGVLMDDYVQFSVLLRSARLRSPSGRSAGAGENYFLGLELSGGVIARLAMFVQIEAGHLH